MQKVIIVADDVTSLPPLHATVVDFNQYLADFPKLGEPKTRVINLCNTDRYLSQGYYCSLLAEARQHKVIPSVNSINDLSQMGEAAENGADELFVPKNLLSQGIDKSLTEIYVFFGWVEHDAYKKLAKYVFERFPAPILQLTLTHKQHDIQVKPKAVGIEHLQEAQWPQFQDCLSHFTKKVWRSQTNRKRHRWDMAILVDPNEKTPPSDKMAIQRFVAAADKLGINADVVTADQIEQVSQYDALFIRETTAIRHHTYRLARKAEQEGLVVIDDATSILRCCNKVFLHDAFSYNKIPSPKTQFVADNSASTLQALIAEFSFPLVLKMPESSFSIGVYKVDDYNQLELKLAEMLKQSALVLVQEYLYTEYDWRIGVLNGRAIYACRYFMARNHWQIYNHTSKKHFSGDYETLPTFEVPRPILDAAVKASNIIGRGLYGVDLKQANNQVYVIEVNDNPSLEYKVEDQYMGKELYMQIMQEFVNRLEKRGR